LEKIKKAHPDNATGYYLLGQLYLSQKKFDSAIHEFEQAMAKSKDISMPLMSIVTANLSQRKPERAVARLNGVIKEFPKYPVAHELLGEVYFFEKKYDEAEQSLRNAIEANPKWNVPYRTLGNIYLVKGDVAKAGQVYQQGLNAVPDDPELQMLLAGSYERARSYDKAIDVYEKVLGKNSANDVAANNLASLIADHRQDPQSLKRAKELAIRFKSSQQPAFMDTLGWVYYKSGETDKAISLLEKVVKQAPGVPVFRYHLGMVYYKKGDLQSAKTQLAKAVESKNEYTGLEEARGILKQIR
jgi:tetratricopeptide (TPR) repeat protein